MAGHGGHLVPHVVPLLRISPELDQRHVGRRQHPGERGGVAQAPGHGHGVGHELQALGVVGRVGELRRQPGHQPARMAESPGQGGQRGLQEGDLLDVDRLEQPGLMWLVTAARASRSASESAFAARPASSSVSRAASERRRLVALQWNRQRQGGLRLRLPDHLAGGDGFGQAFEDETAERPEGMVTAVADEPGQERRGQDLPVAGPVAEPLGHDHGGAEPVVAFPDRLAGVEPDPYRQRRRPGGVLPGHGLLHGDRGGDRRQRAGEGGHQPVPETLDLGAAVGGQRLAQQAEVAPVVLVGGVPAQALEQLGRSLHTRRPSRPSSAPHLSRRTAGEPSSPRSGHNCSLTYGVSARTGW